MPYIADLYRYMYDEVDGDIFKLGAGGSGIVRFMLENIEAGKAILDIPWSLTFNNTSVEARTAAGINLCGLCANCRRMADGSLRCNAQPTNLSINTIYYCSAEDPGQSKKKSLYRYLPHNNELEKHLVKPAKTVPFQLF